MIKQLLNCVSLFTLTSDDASVCFVSFCSEFMGFAGVASKKHFCSKCDRNLSDLNNFTSAGSNLATHAVVKASGERWRRCKTKTARYYHVKDHGTRYTALAKLEYFDLVDHHAIDLFHNILEGTIFYDVLLRDVYFFPKYMQTHKVVLVCYYVCQAYANIFVW